MKKWIIHTNISFLFGGLFFACRGGVHKDNDHDYDGRNENKDRTEDINSQASDSTQRDCT